MVDMYLRQRWQDKRLAFTPVDNSVSMIWLRKYFWEKIWVPDTFFRNEEGANFHYVTVENRLMTLNATGHLWYVIKQVTVGVIVGYNVILDHGDMY